MRAAEAAGYHPLHGYVLMRNDAILAAIHEESTKKLQGHVLTAVKALVDIVEDEDHKDRFKAAKEIAAMNGYTPEQKITVKHISSNSNDLMQQIRAMAKEIGEEELRPLIAKFGITDGEFTEVEDSDD